MQTHYTLPAWHTLTATVVDGKGSVRQANDPTVGANITNAGASVFGPYMNSRVFNATSNVTVVIAESTALANIPSTAQAALLDAIPIVDQDDSVSVWNDAGALKVSTAP